MNINARLNKLEAKQQQEISRILAALTTAELETLAEAPDLTPPVIAIFRRIVYEIAPDTWRMFLIEDELKAGGVI